MSDVGAWSFRKTVFAALAAGLLALVLWTPGVAHADVAPAPTAPYGGALDDPDPGDQVNGENILEVAMLTLGALNGVAVIVAIAFHRSRGSSTAATRDALRRRTGAGVVSESRRERRERAEGAAGPVLPVLPVPVVDPEPVVPLRRSAHAAVPARARHAAPPARPSIPTQGRPAADAVPAPRSPAPLSPARGMPTARRG